MRYFRKDPDVWYKDGRSPVSEADIAVNRFLHAELLAARPDYGWLSEETEDDKSRLEGDAVFVVDPIDGTRAYVRGDDVWCVSVAVVRDGVSVAGILACPAREEFFEGSHRGDALKNGKTIKVATAGSGDLIAAPDAVYDRLPENLISGLTRSPHISSLAYRVAMVADGRLAATFIKPNSHDWDLAAADLILRNAGGAIVDIDGSPLRYNRSTIKHGVLIAGPDEFLPVLQNAAAGIDL
ncbi:MAG: 3'(2'),5'-bisphosphate nucleotidase CysQ [Hyphomicrobiales bacterium]|nr:3'(2'),5'-bisphosphate nucleotidase CysQ [Hyphomicrobiales bacterium]MCP5000841.1 3'(2'),5'-bisphosphate nucleotidase CysQ [Hyphomicrobiales bacterium]